MMWCLIEHRENFALNFLPPRLVTRGSSVSILAGCGLEDRWMAVRLAAETREFLLRQSVYTSSEAHPVFCLLCSGVCFPVNEAVGALQWPYTYIWRTAINPLAYTNACQAFLAIDVFSFNSSLLSVDGMTCLIPFQSLRNDLSHLEIVSIFRL